MPYRTLAVAAAACVVAAVPGSLFFLQYHREGILSGEAWRMLSGHIVHAGPTHFMWDIAGLLAIGFLFEEALGARFWTTWIVSAVTISVGLILFDPDLVAYCGLSGVLNGLWVAGSVAAANREHGRGRVALTWFYRSCLAVLAAKLTLEGFMGQAIFTDAASLGADPVPHAHVMGALGGVLAVFTWSFGPRSNFDKIGNLSREVGV
jgi:rhomboid family GlyGly-CTERM serine protease